MTAPPSGWPPSGWPPSGWQVALALPSPAVSDSFEAAFDDLAVATTLSEDRAADGWRLTAYLVQPPDEAGLAARIAAAAARAGIPAPDFRIEAVRDIDWVGHVHSRSPPVAAGRFFLHGSHFTGAAPPGSIAIRIDAGAAFGAGGHHSTRGCLLALDRLGRDGECRNALDMGCGSGVLAIAMARMWGCPVLACDSDPVAVAVARDNAAANGVAGHVRIVRSHGFRNAAVRPGAPYDVIAANILARPLARMAPAIARHLAPGGLVVLSGFLGEQAASVTAAYGACGLAPLDPVILDGWHTSVMKRPAR